MHLEKIKKICGNDFSFDMPTFIYGGDVDYYEMKRLIEEHPINNTDYIEMGELTDQEFKAIIECFLNSNSVKRGIQRKLAS